MPHRPKDRPKNRPRPGRTPGATHEQVERRQRFERARRESLKPDEGTTVLYGWHTVTAALANPERRLRRLLATENAARRLADEKLAYVGSANVLGTGEGTSLEAGVLVDGRAAAQVARLVAGVLRIARRL